MEVTMDAENVCHICQTTEELEQFQVDGEEIHLCNDCRDEHVLSGEKLG
jgi:ribosome-binding protein aMBF1 (putative translation factor)